MDSPGTNEALPQLAELSELAFRSSELMGDPVWEQVAEEVSDEYDQETEWLDVAKELRRRLRDLAFRLSDLAAG